MPNTARRHPQQTAVSVSHERPLSHRELGIPTPNGYQQNQQDQELVEHEDQTADDAPAGNDNSGKRMQQNLREIRLN